MMGFSSFILIICRSTKLLARQIKFLMKGEEHSEKKQALCWNSTLSAQFYQFTCQKFITIEIRSFKTFYVVSG